MVHSCNTICNECQIPASVRFYKKNLLLSVNFKFAYIKSDFLLKISVLLSYCWSESVTGCLSFLNAEHTLPGEDLNPRVFCSVMRVFPGELFLLILPSVRNPHQHRLPIWIRSRRPWRLFHLSRRLEFGWQCRLLQLPVAPVLCASAERLSRLLRLPLAPVLPVFGTRLSFLSSDLYIWITLLPHLPASPASLVSLACFNCLACSLSCLTCLLPRLPHSPASGVRFSCSLMPPPLVVGVPMHFLWGAGHFSRQRQLGAAFHYSKAPGLPPPTSTTTSLPHHLHEPPHSHFPKPPNSAIPEVCLGAAQLDFLYF